MGPETVSGAGYEVLGEFVIRNNRTQGRSRMKWFSATAATARLQINTAAQATESCQQPLEIEQPANLLPGQSALTNQHLADAKTKTDPTKLCLFTDSRLQLIESDPASISRQATQ